MGNIIQKVIYNSSLFIPFFITFGAGIYLSSNSIMLFYIIEGVALILLLLLTLQIYYAKDKTNAIILKIKNIKLEKPITIFQVLAYAAPLSNKFIEINISYLCIIAVAILFFSIISSPTSPNPILRIFGFRFYKIDLENGIADNLLISSKKITSIRQIKYAHHFFDNTFIY